MSKSILTEIFGVAEGYELVRTEYGGDWVCLHLDVQADQFICPGCASHEVSRKGHRHRELQTVPVGLTPVFLRTEVPDCACRDCGLRFELSPPLPPPIVGSPIEWWRSSKPSPK